MTQPVTLVLPVFDGRRYLEETLRSLLAQEHAELELVVVDNASTDGSAELAESLEDPRLRVVRAAEHLPMVASWNRAAEQAQGELFALCHADDLYEPEWLGTMLELLEGRPRAFAAHCRVTTIDETGREIRSAAESFKDRSWPEEEPCEREPADELAVLARGNYLLAPTVLYRRSAVDAIGPFSDRFPFAADWDYWIRGLLAGFTIAGTHRRLVRYRRHPHMTTRLTERDLSRYEDDLAIPEWAASEGHAAGLLESPEPDHRAAINILSSAIARRLSEGDREGARRLLELARERARGFRGSARDRLLAAARWAGRAGGLALRAAEAAYARWVSG